MSIAPMTRPWRLHLPSDAHPADKRGTLYHLVLPIHDLEARLDQAITQSSSQYAPYHDLQTGIGQPATEHRALLTFQRRLHAMPDTDTDLHIAPGELPLSFNDDIFAGHFDTVSCLTCNTVRPPSATTIRAFSDTDGMQYSGHLRCCPCGQVLAHAIDGYRRP